ncbi:MAG: class I SAM-dependent methyltransferase [Chitinophagaceae bacterium]
MNIKATPQNLMEWIALNANLIPVTLIHTQIYPLLSKAILDAHSLDVFEAFKDGSKTLDQAAGITHLNKHALKSLLNVLTVAGYLSFKNNQYQLTRISKKWCLKNSPDGLYYMQAYNQITWHWLNYLQTFLKTGKGIQYHDNFNSGDWELYQNGMENIATIAAKPLTKIGPKLKEPKRMLDIGGSHGLFSLEYVKKYPTLHATILDLPPAVEKAELLLKRHYKGDKIDYRKGNALTDDFGENEYDVILIASLMHHFTAQQNFEVSKKASKALKQNGYFIIHEFLRPKESGKMEIISTVMDLYFNLSSTSGNWSAKEFIEFQESAGLKHIAIKKFMTIPGLVQIIAQKI